MTDAERSRPHRADIKAVVANESGSDKRECLLSEAASAGCRLTGNVEGLPDVICIQVSGVAKPMKGRIVSRDPGSVTVSFSWSQAPQAGEGSAATVIAAKTAEKEASARRLADEIIRLWGRLQPSIL